MWRLIFLMFYFICSLTPPHPLSLLDCMKQSTWKDTLPRPFLCLLPSVQFPAHYTLLHQPGRRHQDPIGRPADQSESRNAFQRRRRAINLGTEEQWPLSAGRLLQYTCIFVLHPVNAPSVGTPRLILTPLWRYCITAMVSKKYKRIYLTNRPRGESFSCCVSCHWMGQ